MILYRFVIVPNFIGRSVVVYRRLQDNTLEESQVCESGLEEDISFSLHRCVINELGSLSTRVFETRTATGREHVTCQDSDVSQIFTLIISNGKKVPGNVNVVVRRQVKRENSSLPVAVRVSKMRVLKLITREI